MKLKTPLFQCTAVAAYVRTTHWKVRKIFEKFLIFYYRDIIQIGWIEKCMRDMATEFKNTKIF